MVATKSGLSPSTLKKWMSGTEPKVEALYRVARTCGVTIEDILEGDDGQIPRQRSSPASDSILIRRFDVALSAGPGAFVDRAEQRTPIPFAPDFFQAKLGGRSPADMVIVDARGDSMAPTIGSGDLVMIDTADQRIREGVYGVSLGDELYVKRVATRLDGFDLRSDNPAYPPIPVDGPDRSALQIIGRVVWIGRTI